MHTHIPDESSVGSSHSSKDYKTFGGQDGSPPLPSTGPRVESDTERADVS